MTAIRTARAAEGKFVQISNAALQDRRLTASARGILAFVLSLPPDQHLTAEWLETQLPDGRRAIRSALRNLAECGYYRRSRTSDGRTWTWEQVISDAPIEGASSQVTPSDRFAPDGNPPDANRPGKTPNTVEPKDVGPVDLASRRARAKDASATWTVRNVTNAVREAVAQVHTQQDADDLADEEALGLFFTYVGARRPANLVPYLAKIFCDAPYMDTFLANSSPACLRCQKWDADCECPAA